MGQRGSVTYKVNERLAIFLCGAEESFQDRIVAQNNMCLAKWTIVIGTSVFKTTRDFVLQPVTDLIHLFNRSFIAFCHQKWKQNWVCSMERTPVGFWDSVFSSVKWSVGLHQITFKILFSCGDWEQAYMNHREELACLTFKSHLWIPVSSSESLQHVSPFPLCLSLFLSVHSSKDFSCPNDLSFLIYAVR